MITSRARAHAGELDQELDRRGDVVGLKDHRAAVGSDRYWPGVQNRRLHLARDRSPTSEFHAALPHVPGRCPGADWPNFEAE